MSRKKEGASGAPRGTQSTASPSLTRQAERMNRDQLRENAAAKLEKFLHHPNPEVREGLEAVQSPMYTRMGKQESGMKSKSVEGLSGGKENNDSGEVNLQIAMSQESGIQTETYTQKEGSGSQNAEPTLNEIMLAIKQCTTTVSGLSDQVQGIRADISLLRQDAQKIRERTEELEKRVSEAEDKLLPLDKDMKKLTQRIEGQALRLEDLENRMRRKNLRIVGFPEKAEGSNPVGFMEKWLGEAVGREYLSPYFSIERAHRVPMRKGIPGDIPRSILVRVSNYRDKEIVLHRARILRELLYNDGKIMIFPDYSPEVRKRRASFQEVKKRMRTLQLQYAVLYPAKLRVQAQDSVQFFVSPEAATDWLDRNYNR